MTGKQIIKSKFTRLLLNWNKGKNNRQMPWKGEKDPYKIWLSEIILQQTRVEQGLGYYKKFLTRFQDIHKLAAAKDEVVYKMWEGLGYYSRCKNLLETARFISGSLKGKFPGNYEDILKLKGVGNYTAAAIASFAYNQPYAVSDGNVYRVLTRYFGISKPIDIAAGKKYFNRLAADLIDKNEPGIYNQALMDFGAVICKPQNPLCGQCVFSKLCIANKKKLTGKLPVKHKKIKIKKRWFYYLVAGYRNKLYIRKRTAKDIWRELNEFILIEKDKACNTDLILKEAKLCGLLSGNKYAIQSVSPVIQQQLSHQKIYGQFIKIKLTQPLSIPGLRTVNKQTIRNFAFPRLINDYLEMYRAGPEKIS
jgi:A/G-specific adenine glycosylase